MNSQCKKSIILQDNSKDYLRAMMEDTLSQEFPKYFQLQKLLRIKLIYQNSLIKIAKYKSKKKGNFKKCEKNIENSSISCNSTFFIPKGIFVYPSKETYRTQECFNVKFIPNFENLEKFQDLLNKISETLNYFEDYPHNKEYREIVSNENFIVWVFVKFIKKTNFQSENELVSHISSILNKTEKYIYSVISYHFSNKGRYSSSKDSSILSFRENYCEICMLFFCKKHFQSNYLFKNFSLEQKFHVYSHKINKPWIERQILRDSENFPNQDLARVPSPVYLNKTFDSIFHNTCYILSSEKQVKSKYKLYFRNNIYEPCSHDGPCSKNNCPCVRLRGVCEKFCSCAESCDYLFTGCECQVECRMQEENSSCSCASNGRECDPDYCLCTKKCQNMNIHLNKKSKTCLGRSIICESLGAFALEDIAKDSYICEYLGEILTKEETDRRTLFNDLFGLNYLFSLNDLNDIDAYRIGNEMRYVNHSAYGYENCYARGIYSRGEKRIVLFAKRDILRGEELFFDYQIQINVPWLVKYNRQYGLSNQTGSTNFIQ